MRERFFLNGEVELRLGDCLEAMGSLGTGSVDAVITDPPYCSGGVMEAAKGRAKGQGLRGGAGRFQWFDGDNMSTPGLAFLLRAVACEALRVVKPSGHLLMFCDWRMVATLAPAVESAGWRMRNLVVWDKGSMGLGTGFRPSHEMVLHLTHRAPEFHAADVGNVIRSKRVHSSARVHPTEKPVELLRHLVRVTTPRSGIVLDPFAGSGTTGEAAYLEGARAVLIERDESYHEAIVSRLSGMAAAHSADMFSRPETAE